MEIGALFLLVLIAIVGVVVGGLVYAIAARGRRRQLSSEGGTLDANRPEEAREKRPEHVTVESEQRTRFVGTK